ncbi:MAG: BamA/TamA family outer membrane protein [Pirellulaceae bacterium]
MTLRQSNSDVAQYLIPTVDRGPRSIQSGLLRACWLGCWSVVILAASGCYSWTPRSEMASVNRQLMRQGDRELATAVARETQPPAVRYAASTAASTAESNSVRLVSTELPVSTPLYRAQDGGPYYSSGSTTYSSGTQQPAPNSTGPTGLPRTAMPSSGSVYQGPATGGVNNAGTAAPRVAQNVEPGYPSMQPPGDWSGAPQDMIPYSPFADDRMFSTPNGGMNLPRNFADLNAVLQENQTGKFMVGAGINSDAGVTGQVIYDEQNFDIRAWPRSWRDFLDGYAFRGAGQNFRIEAYPGSQVQRYMVSFKDPYFRGTPVSLGVSGYFFDRNYFDWQEQRIGGRVSLGYRITPDIAITGAVRGESVNIHDPRVNTSASLNSALGNNDLFSGELSLSHDTRDNPYAATEGYFLELAFQQAFGSYDYSRGDLQYNRYFLLRERPDFSGRHTLMLSTNVGVTGSQTPIFENYFAGGFSTLRGWDFRGASPLEGGVRAGGEFRWINTVEYLFPLTADDMIKGVVFCDFGTVEEKVGINWDDFRVAPGFGFRVSVPRMGMGAPLAFDFAFPLNDEFGDDRRVFSFFMGWQR